jgi:hypothetical protein
MSSYTISKVGWHTQTLGNTETTEQIHRRFHTLASFLQDNGLTVRTLLAPNDVITDESAIRSSDLTDEGLFLLKKCYDRWLKKIDKGMPPDDVTLLQRELLKLRQ